MKVSKQEVTYIDHMGTDLTVVNAARVSFHKESEWEVVPGKERFEKNKHQLSSKDQKLISYLARHGHWSPFAHTSIQLRVKAPIFVARQLVKHQVGGVWNEVSRRYVDDEPEFYFPDVWRGKPENAKQGSSGIVDITDVAVEFFDGYSLLGVADVLRYTLEMYNALLANGVAPEQARMVLPQNTMTEWYWTGSLQFFARVCQQRLDPHAQQETQEVAKMINDICADLFPVSWKALCE